MKNYFAVLIITIFLTSCASNSSFHSFYKKNKKESTFYISSPAFITNLFIPKDDVEEYEDLLKKVSHYKVMIFSDGSTSIDKKFERFIKVKDYTTLIRVKQNGDQVQFYFLKNGDVIKEMILKVKSNNDYVLLGLKTKISENDFNSIIENADVDITSN